MNINNYSTNNLVTIVNAFNSFFFSVAENLINKPLDNNYPSDLLLYLNLNFTKPTSSLSLNHTPTYEMNNIIQSLKPKDSYGCDEISSRILKISAPFILSPLTHIFNKTLHTGIFPERMKYSVVKPLFKKGLLLNWKIIDLFRY